jgi:F420-dependent oxidoreductase-like protein
MLLNMDLIREAESLGFDSIWTAEAYGSDAVSPLAWIGAQTSRIKLGTAIMQMPARTPAMTAMTAATLDLMSGGRVLLGLGTSGPQVAEGWHGQAFGKPLGRTREYVEIVRAAIRRDLVEHTGDHYAIPYAAQDATGLGKPLKLMMRPLRDEIPVYLAAIGPKNVALATEIADGWLPVWVSPEHLQEVFGETLATAKPGFDVAAFSVPVALTDDVQAGRDFVKPHLALYVGGMGAKGQNYYTALVSRYGYEAEAATIQELYLEGKKMEAIAAVPDALVDEVALVGPRERIADRLDAWRESGVTTLLVQTHDRATLRTMAELVL